ncbi:meiosis-specific nuclear structural protein, putative [Entamoeba dispar SAW760]|uniref:Meiosis-specific nuclear structural protein, putative n=1 Tax=Entamoeba dispar (strain ATCC PRA-260 / SAW760) TaxID=370354 RepID=B0EFG4_ENTDS|nr:meiosis-specific nuclear structural protein, putative [Entamoeba dispar SAW760]EDR26743.1 meiosis-specific nuclear structural protein, putative [Entamoeba dispar SAW760]|eukprot:EDR26743.1 meiosis-specific nuclear structural protein, putative [Entamoeba dispar SAW760]
MSQMIVKAKCNVASHSSLKLSFMEGDSIKVVDRMSNGLWKGTLNNQTGLFHISTVSIPVIETVVMNYDFSTGDSTCMKTKAGEVLKVIEKNVRIGWLYCQRGFETGYIPQNFTSLYKEETKEVSQTVPEKPKILPCRATVKQLYQPHSDKEINLITGDEIEVMSCEGGWWYGRSGCSMGYFPGEYVEVSGTINKEVKQEAVVLFDYVSKGEYQLSAEVGDIFYVEKIIGSWAIVIVDQERFIFPSSFICLLSESDKKIKQETAITLDDFCGGSMGLLAVRQSELLIVLSNEANGMSKCFKGEQSGLVPTSNLMTIKDGQDYVIVEKTFQARNQNEMTIIANQAWIVMKIVDENWIIGKRSGVEGFVPRSFVKIQKFVKPYRKEYTEGITHFKNQTAARKTGDAQLPVDQPNFFKKENKASKKGFFTQRRRKAKPEVDNTKHVYEEKKQNIMRESMNPKRSFFKKSIKPMIVQQEHTEEKLQNQEGHNEKTVESQVKEVQPVIESNQQLNETTKQEEQPKQEIPQRDEEKVQEVVQQTPSITQESLEELTQHSEEEVKQEEPKQEEPKQEEPKQEEPKQEEIKQEEIKQDEEQPKEESQQSNTELTQETPKQQEETPLVEKVKQEEKQPKEEENQQSDIENIQEVVQQTVPITQKPLDQEQEELKQETQLQDECKNGNTNLESYSIKQENNNDEIIQKTNETYDDDYVDEEKEKAFEEIEELKLELDKMRRERDFLQQTLDEEKAEVQQIREQHDKDIVLVASLQQTIQQQQNQINELTRKKEETSKEDMEKIPPTLEEDEVITTLKVRVTELEQQVAIEKKARLEGAEVIKMMKASQSGGVSQVELDDFKSEIEERVKGLQSRLKILTAENEKLRKAGAGARLERIKAEADDKMAKYKDEITIMKRKLNLLIKSIETK